MGSGNKRKNNDAVRINRPQKTAVGSGGSGSGGSSSRDINKICPPAFDIRIKPELQVPDGTPVIINGEDLFVLNKSVGKLSNAHIKIISECGAEGISYVGHVLNKDNKAYARFEQNPRG